MKYVVINVKEEPVLITEDPIALYNSGKIQPTDRIYQIGNQVQIQTKIAVLSNTRGSFQSDQSTRIADDEYWGAR